MEGTRVSLGRALHDSVDTGGRRTALLGALLPLCLAVSIFSGCGDGASTGPGEQSKAWTFMFYDQADAPLGSYDPMEDFCKRVSSGPSVDFVVLRDTNGDSARIWYVDSAHEPVLREELGEVNMGDGQTLFDFIDYSKANFPARRYVLGFYGHGGGWRGACFDRTSQYDALTMDEIAAALVDAGGVDLVVFTSNCFMGAVESAYELRGCADVYVGSENFCGYAFWDAPMGDICREMHRSPGMSNEDLAQVIVDAVWERRDMWSEEDWYNNLTVSAVRPDSLVPLVEALDAVALDYLSSPARLHARVSWVYFKICSFGDEVVDIYHLAHCLLMNEDQDSTRARLETVRSRLLDCVICECHDPVWNAYGLSVYFPYMSEYGCQPEYGAAETALDFAQDTHWDELLEVYPYPLPDGGRPGSDALPHCVAVRGKGARHE
jgi:hypothetical protein